MVNGRRWPPSYKPPFPYRGGKIGLGWYEDHIKDEIDAVKKIKEQESVQVEHKSRDQGG